MLPVARRYKINFSCYYFFAEKKKKYIDIHNRYAYCVGEMCSSKLVSCTARLNFYFGMGSANESVGCIYFCMGAGAKIETIIFFSVLMNFVLKM